jgi:CheY-like chemotaxis protein
MLGHELRNPVSVITGGLKVMEHPAATADAQDRARQMVRRQCGSLTCIVDELLDASRVLTGKVTLSRKRVDMAEIARSSAEAVQMSGASDRHRLGVQTSHAWVDGDPTRLTQIATNLLENALKYTPDGGHVELTVAVDGPEAVLTVRDTGVGIGPELLSHVFDVFVQGPTPLDRSKGRLGIGLAVVSAMVQQHAGSVVAESAGEGLGSCFTVRLPLLPGQNGTAAEGADSSVAQPVSGRRILVVDDNDDARATLADFLMLEGLDVLQARDGAEALRIVLSDQPPIALIDIGLPDIDGYEVARRLRLDPRTNAMRLVALTGYGQEADRERAQAAGFDRHLTKPVDLDELLAAI